MSRILRRHVDARLAVGSKQTLRKLVPPYVHMKDDDYVDAVPTRENSGVFDGYKQVELCMTGKSANHRSTPDCDK